MGRRQRRCLAASGRPWRASRVEVQSIAAPSAFSARGRVAVPCGWGVVGPRPWCWALALSGCGRGRALFLPQVLPWRLVPGHRPAGHQRPYCSRLAPVPIPQAAGARRAGVRGLPVLAAWQGPKREGHRLAVSAARALHGPVVGMQALTKEGKGAQKAASMQVLAEWVHCCGPAQLRRPCAATPGAPPRPHAMA